MQISFLYVNKGKFATVCLLVSRHDWENRDFRSTNLLHLEVYNSLLDPFKHPSFLHRPLKLYDSSGLQVAYPQVKTIAF